ncbi:MAG TPA: NADH-quinone oxidoreductase subunit B, partial [Kaistella sp.]|nr:NADH-quinone oxidoreductase subunit B [Kaistella sp.]
GFMQVQALSQSESLRRRDLPQYKELLESYNIN